MFPKDRDFNKYSKKYLFAILGFFYKLLSIFKVHCKKIKTILEIEFGFLVFAQGSLEQNKVLQSGPWPVWGNRGAAAGCFLGDVARRRWGQVGEKKEGAKPHLWRVLEGREVVGEGLSTAALLAPATGGGLHRRGGAPVVVGS